MVEYCHICEQEFESREGLTYCDACGEYACSSCFNLDRDCCDQCDTVACSECGNEVSSSDSRYCEECCEDFCINHFGNRYCVICEWVIVKGRLVVYLAERKLPIAHVKDWMQHLQDEYSSWTSIAQTEEGYIEKLYETWKSYTSFPENENSPIGKIEWITT